MEPTELLEKQLKWCSNLDEVITHFESTGNLVLYASYQDEDIPSLTITGEAAQQILNGLRNRQTQIRKACQEFTAKLENIK